MEIFVEKVYKVNNIQYCADCILINSTDSITKRLKISELINLVKNSNGVSCKNFQIIDDSYIRGKDCSLRMEEVKNDKVKTSNRKQKNSNRERVVRTERGTVTERKKRDTKQAGGRGCSIECSEKYPNKCGAVQDVTRVGILDSSNGISILPECSPQKFYNDFLLEHNKMEFSPCVDIHSVEQLSSMHCFGHSDLGFVAITDDGNICSVLKSSRNNKSGFTKDIMINALRHGGDKLDCYAINNGGLVEFYMKCGFVPVCRLKFNQEYAPDGWKEEWGYPDVVFMMHNLDTADEVLSKYGSYENYNQYLEIHDVPYFEDYDEAGEFRDKLLAESKENKYGKSVKGVFNFFKKAVSDLKI